MSTLRIALLGPPEVEHGGYRITFPDRKTLALLAYLAAEEGVHERQKLTHLLWPESDMAHGRTALRIALLHLRHILEEDASPERASHLLITHDTLGLDLASSIDLDLYALETAWKLVRVLPGPDAVEGEVRRSLIAHLYRVATLYRGSFLQDFTLRNTIDFDNWLGRQQGYWYQRIEQVFDWLSQMQSVEGELEQAIATIERWRSFDPLNEDISLRLMQLQFATGNRIAALKTFETYEEILMTELSARPSAKLVALTKVLRDTSSPPRAYNAAGRRISTARPLFDVPFVGRGTEFSRLIALYEQTFRGQPQVALLEGEAGIGKTRLAAAFLDWVRAQGANVLEGRTFQTSQRLSYQPLLEALRTRIEQEHDLRQRLPDPWLTELSRLLPDLRERYPGLPLPTNNGAFASARLFEALARLLQAFAERAPLLIFIDDLQWMDAATLDVFQYLARYWTEHQTPALLLLGLRTETREMEPEMSEWLAYLKRDVPLTRLVLGTLTVKDTLQITRELPVLDGARTSLLSINLDRQPRYASTASRSGGVQGEGEHAPFQPSSQHVQAPSSPRPERFGTWLFAETNGQPFYLQALLQMLLDRGELVPHLIEGSGWVFEPQPWILEATRPGSLLPPDVCKMVECRLARLSPPTRELLAAGATLDHNFTFEQLCQVAHLTTQDGLAALDEALQSLLLHESNHQCEGRGQVFYHFAHDKIREVVYAAAGDARRRVFHDRALTILWPTRALPGKDSTALHLADCATSGEVYRSW
jgi:DNA-binding SARP family transcriptional activator